MTPDEAKTVVALLIAAYPHDGIEQETFDLYAAALERLRDPAAAQEAVRRLVLQTHRFPTIATIMGAYQEQRELRIQEQRQLEQREADARAITAPPEVRERMRSWAVRDLNLTDPVFERSQALPDAGRGQCHDCQHDRPQRLGDQPLVRLGKLQLCASCASNRLRVAAAVSEGST